MSKRNPMNGFGCLFAALITVVAVGFLISPSAAAATTPCTITAGDMHTVGLKIDGTVVGVGDNTDDQLEIGTWTDIVQIDARGYCTLGLKSDGTVVAVGSNNHGELNVDGWSGIVQVVDGVDHTVGLKSDGTVVAVGNNDDGQLNVNSWSNITQIAATYNITLGLKSDGTVVGVGDGSEGQLNVSTWTDIVQVDTGGRHTVGLKADGTVVGVGTNGVGQLNFDAWTDIVQIAASTYCTVGLKADGTVVGVGQNIFLHMDFDTWSDIVQVDTSSWHTVGLKSDGTVVAIGYNEYGQLNVDTWTNIGQSTSNASQTMPWIPMLLLGDDTTPPPITGEPWRFIFTETVSGDSEVEFLSLTYNGDQVTATDLCDPDPPVQGTLVGATITFSFTAEPGLTIEMTGTVSGETMSGSFTANGTPAGTWQAEKLDSPLNPKTCVTETAEAKCFYFPWSDSYGIMAYLEDYNALVQSAVISGSYISGTSPLTYNLHPEHPGEWYTDPNPIISYGSPPPFPLSYTVHVVFKDSSTADIPFTITGYETAD